jgi:hypothetical protein
VVSETNFFISRRLNTGRSRSVPTLLLAAVSTSCKRRFCLANLWSSGLFIKHFCYGCICDVSCLFVHVCWWKASTARDGQETLIVIVWFHGYDAVWFTRYSITAHSHKALFLPWTCFSQFCVSHLLLVDTNVFKSPCSSTTEVIRLEAGVLGDFGSVWCGDRFCSSLPGAERPWLLAAWLPLGTEDTVVGIVADRPFPTTGRLKKLPIGLPFSTVRK